MRFLHTADWHIGKKLGRVDRSREFEQVLDEVVALGTDQNVDATIVAGDLLDRAMPPLDCLSLVLETLIRLTEDGRYVVAIPGNHDSAALFEMLRPLVEARRIVLAPRIRRPEDGGVIRIPSRDGSESAQIAVFPFLHESEVVDFMATSEEWFKGYSERVMGISQALTSGLDPDAVAILTGHFFVSGAELGGGERKIHIGPQYATTPQAIPPTVHYAALGHIHRPQDVPGAPVPARYAGSLLQLDFSERTHTKEVVIVEGHPGRPAKIKRFSLSSGRKLLRVEDTLESLLQRVPEFADSYLDVRVKTSGPMFGLAEQVRSFLPNALLIQAVYERDDAEVSDQEIRAERPLAEVYADFYASSRGHGVQATDELIETFRSLELEVSNASS